MATFVTLYGNIGSGKSTLLSELQRLALRDCKVPLRVLCEPVEEWCRPVLSDGADSMLSAFYADPRGSAMAFQMHVLYTRMKQIEKAMAECDDDTIFVVERGPWVDLQLMGVPVRRTGAFSDMQWEVCRAWHDAIVARLPPLSGSIYLRTAPDKCAERIEHRRRPAEIGKIDLDYLNLVHEAHDEFAFALDGRVGKPTLVVESPCDEQTTTAQKVLTWIESELVRMRTGTVH